MNEVFAVLREMFSSFISTGSYTFIGVPTDKGFNVFAEYYSVSGLQGGTKYQKSNTVTVPAVVRPKIKVGGDYKNVTNTHIKVSGAYKQVTEIYVKVNGIYKRIVN